MPKFIGGTPGNDVLSGEPRDTLDGGEGSDTYIIYDSSTVVRDSANPNSYDLLYTFVSYDASSARVEYISAADHSSIDPINLIGSSIGQTLIGNNGNNILDGRGGGDTMYGLLGDDIYYARGGDTIVERPGEGYDRIYSATNFVLADGVSIEYLSIEFGTGFRDAFLTGNSFTQTIVGNADSNILNSGGGADTLIGGGGDDTYRVFGQGETVIEGAQGGNDTVYTSGNFYLAAGSAVETISAADQGFVSNLYLLGNELSQRLIGDYGNNTLNGGGGAAGDTLVGLYGDDIYRVYGQNDVIVEQPGQGNDIVYTSGNYRLAAGVSVETLSTHFHVSTLAMNLTGNELANLVIGNYGVNILDGGGGSDTLIGLQGADVFRFTTTPVAGTVVQIADYGDGADSILLDSQAFGALTDGVLPAAAFAYGPAATTAQHRIVYDPSTGALSYDTDGNGADAAIQFAQLPTDIALADLRIAVATVPQELLTLRNPGTYLLGDATGSGTRIPDSVTNVTFEFYGIGYNQDLIFGANTSGGVLPSIKFAPGNPGTFDFSQLTQGIVAVPGQGYFAASGQLLIADNYQASAMQVAFPKTLIGSNFADVIGGYLVNSALGGAGNDYIRDAYIIDGGEGDDYMVGSINIQLTGGPGADTFQIPIRTQQPGTLSGSAPNIITDFDPAVDKIVLVINYTRNGTVDLVPGMLSADQFEAGTAPSDTDVRIFYNTQTGELNFLINGNGPTPTGEIFVFARLQPGLSLSENNFALITPDQQPRPLQGTSWASADIASNIAHFHHWTVGAEQSAITSTPNLYAV